MRCFPPPLSVTRPPPSRTTRRLVLTTLAVCVIAIVTGRGPQRNLITPPRATARTTARDVQLRAVPLPTTPAAAGAASAPPSARQRVATTTGRGRTSTVGRERSDLRSGHGDL